MRGTAKWTKAVIGISESKLDRTILDTEVFIRNFKFLLFVKMCHGEGNWEEITTFDVLMPLMKPITTGII